jgi:hypothetical protein
MIKPCPLSISNEKELQNFARPFLIEGSVYFYKDEDGIPVVIFKLNSKYDDIDINHDRNKKILWKKIFIQYSIYKIPVRLNFCGFPLTTSYDDALDFFSKFGTVIQLTLYDKKTFFIVFSSPVESQKCWNKLESQI